MKIYKLTSETPGAEIGVIIGRFQVHKLHEGHKELIQNVLARHERVLVLLGVTELLSTKRNPLDFVSRERMLKTEFPEIYVAPLKDHSYSNEVWSSNLDEAVRNIFPRGDVLLYGSRDSFIDSYSGIFDCVELDTVHNATGTEIRNNISKGIYNSEDFRAGCIYSFYNIYTKAETTVDVAILDENENRILLGRKSNRKGYCFIGGFVDPKQDDNFTQTARRETMEETGIEINDFERIADLKINDSRFKNEENQVFTTFFIGKYMYGKASPADDMNELKWFGIDELSEDVFIDTHQPLFQILENELNKIKGQDHD